MTVFFVDTSALAKRYITEVGSEWVRSWIAPTAGNTIAISQIASVELASVLTRRIRETELQPTIAHGIYSSFQLHQSREYFVTPVTAELLEQAANLLFQHPLRSLDAIQLASAIRTRELAETDVKFVSSDRNLLVAATSSGLDVANPLDHLEHS